MSNSCLSRSALTAVLLAGALGLGVSAASAQGSGTAPAYTPNASETLQVSVPRFHTQRTKLNGSVQPASLSETVPYGDLNLVTWSGSRELHERVRHAAADVCDRLAAAYPTKQSTTTAPCYQRAVDDAMIKVDVAVNNAKQTVRFEY